MITNRRILCARANAIADDGRGRGGVPGRSGRDVGGGVPLVFGVVVRILQRVPLRDRTPRRRQHVGPVPQLGAGRVVAQHHFADWLGRADAVVVDYRHHQVYFLQNNSTIF